MEKLGIPSVTVATEPFLTLAKAVAAAEGVSNACFVTLPRPLGMVPEAQVMKKAEDAFPEVLRMLTDWQPSAGVTEGKAAYPAEKFEFTGTTEEVNRLFFSRGWSLGLPIIPPTSKQVSEMLTGTKRKPDEVLGQIPPKMGTLTVELAAVHAAMAGCRPQYMPILIAALEAFLAPEVNWRGSLSTTGTTQFLIMVNGPIIKETGIERLRVFSAQLEYMP